MTGVFSGFLISVWLLGCVSFLASAAERVSENPYEPRVREIAVTLRCPVCQSENLLDSKAATAREMLEIVREQVAAGATDKDIFEFFVSRYGSYVVFDPPLRGAGLVVWILPLLWLLASVYVFLRQLKARKTRPTEYYSTTKPLSKHELQGKEL